MSKSFIVATNLNKIVADIIISLMDLWFICYRIICYLIDGDGFYCEEIAIQLDVLFVCTQSVFLSHNIVYEEKKNNNNLQPSFFYSRIN